MLLKDRVAVVYGGGGVIGGAVARAFAREGAVVCLAGRTQAKLERVAAEIAESGGRASVSVVDALDQMEVERHVDDVVAAKGRIDIALNAVGIMHVQGTPFAELSLADFEHPLVAYLRTLFLTAKATARPMVERRSGVFLSLSTPAAKTGFSGVAGFGTTCAAIEGFTRHLAVELGAHGVRVLCLRPDALPEAVKLGSHSRRVFEPFAARAGLTVDELLDGPSPSALKRKPTIGEIANAAAFAASDHAGAMTGTVMNLTCGSVVD